MSIYTRLKQAADSQRVQQVAEEVKQAVMNQMGLELDQKYFKLDIEGGDIVAYVDFEPYSKHNSAKLNIEITVADTGELNVVYSGKVGEYVAMMDSLQQLTGRPNPKSNVWEKHNQFTATSGEDAITKVCSDAFKELDRNWS